MLHLELYLWVGEDRPCNAVGVNVQLEGVNHLGVKHNRDVGGAGREDDLDVPGHLPQGGLLQAAFDDACHLGVLVKRQGHLHDGCANGLCAVDDLLDARDAKGDVHARNSSKVECLKRHLGARLADRLSPKGPHRGARVYHLHAVAGHTLLDQHVQLPLCQRSLPRQLLHLQLPPAVSRQAAALARFLIPIHHLAQEGLHRPPEGLAAKVQAAELRLQHLVSRCFPQCHREHHRGVPVLWPRPVQHRPHPVCKALKVQWGAVLALHGHRVHAVIAVVELHDAAAAVAHRCVIVHIQVLQRLHQTPGHVACLGSLHGSVDKPLAAAHGMEEELRGGEATVEGVGDKALPLRRLVVPREVREGAVAEAVGGALPTDALLANACHHLGDVDGRALATTLAHDERRVVAV
mmetsp:Transcript_12902/g.36287  ORF Transcript_12902/g.36287 Transcript_12902/m.36287 type:complete len:406 (-) Transcript_12902:808-2025(-)